MSDNRLAMPLWETFALAAVLNLVEVVADPDGGLWIGARVLASVLFGLALIAWIIAAVQERRRGST
jgi:hypothetical protein